MTYKDQSIEEKLQSKINTTIKMLEVTGDINYDKATELLAEIQNSGANLTSDDWTNIKRIKQYLDDNYSIGIA